MAKNSSLALNKNKNNRTLFIAVSLLSVFALMVAAYFAFGQNIFRQELADPDTTPGISFLPATEADRQEADSNKERLSQTKQESESDTPSNSASSGSSDGKKSVTPTITELTRTSVKGYITGIFEEGGTCLVEFSKDGQTLTKSSEGFQNASYTQCSPIEMSSEFLSPGKWAVSLSYSSATSQGKSDTQYIE